MLPVLPNPIPDTGGEYTSHRIPNDGSRIARHLIFGQHPWLRGGRFDVAVKAQQELAEKVHGIAKIFASWRPTLDEGSLFDEDDRCYLTGAYPTDLHRVAEAHRFSFTSNTSPSEKALPILDGRRLIGILVRIVKILIELKRVHRRTHGALRLGCVLFETEFARDQPGTLDYANLLLTEIDPDLSESAEQQPSPASNTVPGEKEDLEAIACIIYRIATGELDIKEETNSEIKERILSNRGTVSAQTLGEHGTALMRRAWRLVTSDRKERINNLEELLETLGPIPGPPNHPPPPSRWRRPVIYLIVGALIIGLGLMIFDLLKESEHAKAIRNGKTSLDQGRLKIALGYFREAALAARSSSESNKAQTQIQLLTSEPVLRPHNLANRFQSTEDGSLRLIVLDAELGDPRFSPRLAIDEPVRRRWQPAATATPNDRARLVPVPNEDNVFELRLATNALKADLRFRLECETSTNEVAILLDVLPYKSPTLEWTQPPSDSVAVRSTGRFEARFAPQAFWPLDGTPTVSWEIRPDWAAAQGTDDDNALARAIRFERTNAVTMEVTAHDSIGRKGTLLATVNVHLPLAEIHASALAQATTLLSSNRVREALEQLEALNDPSPLILEALRQLRNFPHQPDPEPWTIHQGAHASRTVRLSDPKWPGRRWSLAATKATFGIVFPATNWISASNNLSVIIQVATNAYPSIRQQATFHFTNVLGHTGVITQWVTVTANTAPTISGLPDRISETSNIPFLVQPRIVDDTPIGSSPLMLRDAPIWRVVSGYPNAASIEPNPNGGWDLTFQRAGVYKLDLVATDGALASTQRVLVTIKPSNEDILDEEALSQATKGLELVKSGDFELAYDRLTNAVTRADRLDKTVLTNVHKALSALREAPTLAPGISLDVPYGTVTNIDAFLRSRLADPLGRTNWLFALPRTPRVSPAEFMNTAEAGDTIDVIISNRMARSSLKLEIRTIPNADMARIDAAALHVRAGAFREAWSNLVALVALPLPSSKSNELKVLLGRFNSGIDAYTHDFEVTEGASKTNMVELSWGYAARVPNGFELQFDIPPGGENNRVKSSGLRYVYTAPVRGAALDTIALRAWIPKSPLTSSWKTVNVKIRKNTPPTITGLPSADTANSAAYEKSFQVTDPDEGQSIQQPTLDPPNSGRIQRHPSGGYQLLMINVNDGTNRVRVIASDGIDSAEWALEIMRREPILSVNGVDFVWVQGLPGGGVWRDMPGSGGWVCRNEYSTVPGGPADLMTQAGARTLVRDLTAAVARESDGGPKWSVKLPSERQVEFLLGRARSNRPPILIGFLDGNKEWLDTAEHVLFNGGQTDPNNAITRIQDREAGVRPVVVPGS